ncbi:sugar transporter [Acetobacter aceti NRIC 0242]|uniref:MFS transporter n=1 Tax=Acetobacter aceti NBRC 14818 TaxID=887700 RepID=A0AB33IDG9_ACEAC|nr:sugar porter family MFS transporter [Acetobacter aceti]TCS35423.1 SP family galactose:H+ symporter-like MFS transporter [Acetobacter aceti NBRC 14818]BCK75189.1 MFS transporter [Acetobacter aceti NBRC 14818]GAN57521.1 major facilitator superfamily sugar transporter [Acetobacter aceti NBRC 14818]GBO81768.1 sugar transporter [Acetobacter aceti NRIC 0242]
MPSSISTSAQRDASARVRRTTFFLALAAGLAGLMFGLDTGVIAGALGFIREEFQTNDRTTEWIVSSLMLAAAFGSVLAVFVADKWGRKGTLLVAGGLFLSGTALCSLATSVSMMIVGRACLGLGVGLAAFAAPLYIAEIASQDRRGAMISSYQLMITIGILLAFTSDSLLTPGGHWRIMFGVLSVPTVLFLLTTLLLPYSPRWLLTKGRRQEARDVLLRVRETAEEADAELSRIDRQLGREESAGAALLISNPNFRRTFALGIALQVLQQFSGINVLMYYAPTVLNHMGFNASSSVWCTTAIGVVNTLATLAAVALMDRWGRRLLLSISTFFAAIAMLGFGTLLWTGATSMTASMIAMGFLFLFIAAFAVGQGPLPWIIGSEVQPLRGRTFAVSCSTLASWIANWLISNIFLSSMSVIGDYGVFWCLAGFNALFFVVGLMFVPETKGCSLEDIEDRINSGVRLRDAGQ